MASVVRELQRDALDRNVAITDLLRKALVVAKKLRLAEFERWTQNELDGYGPGDQPPPYRSISGQPRLWNPYRGWIPIVLSTKEQEDWLTRRTVTQAASELEILLEQRRDEGVLHMPFSAKTQAWLSEHAPFQSEATLFVQHSSVAKILDSARTIILNWSLKLEDEGILGDDLAFSERDREQAKAQPHSVMNFFGPVTGAQIQQDVRASAQTMNHWAGNPGPLKALLSELRDRSSAIVLPEDSAAELESELSTLEAQVRSPKPKAGIISEGLKSLRTILEGAGGSIAAEFVIKIGQLLAG